MADKRWKDVERRVASELNIRLSDIGNFSPIERIPLLGRDGPDLTINETGLIINVKSRKSIPPRLFPDTFELLLMGNLVIFRIDTMTNISLSTMALEAARPWKHLRDWYCEMAAWADLIPKTHNDTTIMRNSRMPVTKWTDEFKCNCIPAVILHRPKMPIGKCAVVIDYQNLRRLSCNLKQPTL